MKHYPIVCGKSGGFTEGLESFRELCRKEGYENVVFQIFSELLGEEEVMSVCRSIEKVFPDAPYFGCSTNGNLVDCQLSGTQIVTAIVLEQATTHCMVFQYDLAQASAEEITADIAAKAQAHAWVRAVELYFTIPKDSTTRFCEGLHTLRPDIQIFGGISCSGDITSSDCCVFSKAGGFSRSSVIVVFYGGEEFYVDSIRITGWKPLGRKFHVTACEGSLLRELDGIPAYDVYHKYLNIRNDENFFYNTLEFPLFYEHNDTTILRVPTASHPDGSISMSSDIEVGSTVRISYGDPKTILESIAHDSSRIRRFSPDVMHIFSCAARRTFWTSNEATYELEPFRDIAPSTGFFSHGEFLRDKGCLNQHNVTLVIAAMREGEAPPQEDILPERQISLSKMPLVSRLATFIGATSLELEEMNSRLEAANRNLQQAAITDGMTGLYNRAETQRRIEEQLRSVSSTAFSVIMLDIDNFKQVNDTYGHQEGDAVLVALANILRNEQVKSNASFSAGRWGGEEFMLVLADTEISAASLIAELIRQCFSNTSFHNVRPQTISLGVTQARPDDTVDSLCIRVDTALYKAKKTGKNKVVVD